VGLGPLLGQVLKRAVAGSLVFPVSGHFQRVRMREKMRSGRGKNKSNNEKGEKRKKLQW